MAAELEASVRTTRRRDIKCLVWDLDNTLWDGVLAEGDDVVLFDGVADIVRELDERGILQSIASKNDAEPALERLARFGLAEYFLHPEIHWGSKSASVQRIAEKLNIGIDSVAFIDDQPFERGEVAAAHEKVLCLDSECRAELLGMPQLTPRFRTDEARKRRSMYLSDSSRDAAERGFEGPQEDFLASLKMVFSILPAGSQDLQRLEELVARTNQLNTTGRIYTIDELEAFRQSEHHDLWVASLNDIYGEYGKIGMALVERGDDVWVIKAFLMSCRVMSRGVGSAFLNWILARARAQGVALRAEVIPNERNRMMIATYRFAGFQAREKCGNVEIFEHPLDQVPAMPEYVCVVSS